MQPGGGGAGPSRHQPAAQVGSPSSSSAGSTHLGFDSAQQQQQQQFQHQHQGTRQSLQPQFLRNSDGNENFSAVQGSNLHHAVMGANNFASSPRSMPQQSRKFFDLAQQQGLPQDLQNRRQGVEQQQQQQQALNPLHQAYMQYAFQASQKSPLSMQAQQQRMGNLNLASGSDMEMQMVNNKMQEAASLQNANQAQASSSRNSSEQFNHGEKQLEQVLQQNNDQRQSPATRQLGPGNALKPMQGMFPQQSNQSMANNQLVMATQMQLQAWARENNVDLSSPANSNLVAQLVPLIQARLMSQQQKANEGHLGSQSSPVPIMKPQSAASPAAIDGSSHANSPREVSAQKGRQAVSHGPFGMNSSSGMVNSMNNSAQQQNPVHGRENQVSGQPVEMSKVGKIMQHPQRPANVSLGTGEQSLHVKNPMGGQEQSQMQYLRQLNQSTPQPSSSSGGPGGQPSIQGAKQAPQQTNGWTKQQLYVLKAQILAFRRIKKGESSLPAELLRSIVPPPLELQMQQQSPLAGGSNNQEKVVDEIVEDKVQAFETYLKDSQATIDPQNIPREEVSGEEKVTTLKFPVQSTSGVKEASPAASSGNLEQPPAVVSVKSDPNNEAMEPVRNDVTVDKGKAVVSDTNVPDVVPAKEPVQANVAPQPQPPAKDVSNRKYHGPLFDFPFFTRKNDSFGSGMATNNNNLSLAYNVKDILFEEGLEVLKKKRTENLKKIGGLLAVNLERKRIRPDLVLRLQIEEKKLRLVDLQARLRDEVDQQQQEIMAMPDRPYRKFVRLCDRQRMELARQVQLSQKAVKEKQLKAVFQWRKKLLESHWGIRDARIARNRGVAKYHEKMVREFSKRKDDDRNKRMEALKNNDVERYREMLLEQQTNMEGDAAERYNVLSSFLTQTEEYLQKLGSKITSAKNQQEVEEAANAAALAARLQGLSEEEVRAAAACAGEEVMIRKRFTEMNAPREGSSVSKYYHLAHAVNERVLRQPSMLRAGTLRDYQLVGLQWMLSLYNNKLNGILADEMGLGKTVQVLALIAYLMEFKGNYGPHLIIVPNAVLVNWKSEFHAWLPSASCIFYVGAKDQRAKLFTQAVAAMKFNVLVTTYEFIMYDRAKLSRVDWKYIIIDEAQRMKDRESVLARDLDRYRCQRRLLLTGTPLQNDLKELWSLLNLLLPEVFDNRKAFHDWFAKPFQKEAASQDAEDDWLETEKKVIVIHRLHQILEPFMLRRRVEDVEGSLPPKVSIVLKCRMSGMQSAIYDWIKSTGTLRVDPEDEKLKVQRNPLYQARVYRTLNNRCMELRKACNHPLLNYPYYNDLSKDFLVKSCGKMWILDRVLVKLHRAGHRVLLFSTMTKLLDILEEYLRWRRLVYRRIDGTTTLEDRESAIVEFNRPGSDCFIFLLSIRAAGRGLNLQSADTVVIYDPDPNPKNEEQAVARAHRIGQTREVKVIYMEAVVDKIPTHQKEDGEVDSEEDDDLAGKDQYIGSIESLIRNNIQQYKIDMADEVINAGRFDQRTTHEERRLTLEAMLHDEERYQENVHDVPTLQQVNRMIARSEEEVELFDQMDEEEDWIDEMIRYEQVPKWLRASTREVNASIAASSKNKSKRGMVADVGGSESPILESKRGRTKKKNPNYVEYDDEEISEESLDERNEEEEVEEEEEEAVRIGEYDDEEYSNGALPVNNDQSEADEPNSEEEEEDGFDSAPANLVSNQSENVAEEADPPSRSSSESRQLSQIGSPVSSRKFGSLSALESRQGSLSKKTLDDLEEGEIAVSGGAPIETQQSGSWIHEREEAEDDQILQPKITGKRSKRPRRHQQPLERSEDKFVIENQRGGNPSLAPVLMEEKLPSRVVADPESRLSSVAARQDQISKNRRQMPPRKASSSQPRSGPLTKQISSNYMSAPVEERSRETRDGRAAKNVAVAEFDSKMSDIFLRKCKNVLSKFQRRIEKEGPQIVPLLVDLWKRSGTTAANNTLLDLRKIDHRVDNAEYNDVMELVSDVQYMLKGAMHFYSFNHEVRTEARKVHDLFFDILKIAFPDTDFQEARAALSFSNPVPGPSTRQGLQQNKKTRGGALNEVDPTMKPPQRIGPSGLNRGESTRIRVQIPQKESTKPGSNSGSGNDTPVLSHPGELVVCKKKRKAIIKPRVGPISPPAQLLRNNSSGLGLSIRDAKVGQQSSSSSQGWPNSRSPSGTPVADVGWANPVKRLRTDSGKRRPSQL